MYNETGSKIKNLATAMAWVGIIFSVLLIVVPILMYGSGSKPGNDPAPEWFGFVVIAGIVLGIIIAFWSWLQYLLLAGYGELIEETSKSAAELKEIKEILSKKQGEEMKDSYSTK